MKSSRKVNKETRPRNPLIVRSVNKMAQKVTLTEIFKVDRVQNTICSYLNVKSILKISSLNLESSVTLKRDVISSVLQKLITKDKE